MGDAGEKVAVGDKCFAHVRSFPWWPAQIVGKKVMKSKRGQLLIFSVMFYGTGETANLPEKELRSLSSESIEKCVTKAALRRKHFKEGYEELLRDSGYLQQQEDDDACLSDKDSHNGTKNVNSQAENNPESYTKQEFLSLFGLNENISQPPPYIPANVENIQSGEPNPQSDPINDQAEISCSYKSLIEVSCDDDAEFDKKTEYECRNCSKLFSSEINLEKHYMLMHRKVAIDADYDDEILIPSILKPTSTEVAQSSSSKPPGQGEVPDNSIKPKKTKQKRKVKTKLLKSLQEDEIESNKLFAEKIEVRHTFFFCKSCNKFSTTTKMRAKSHAVSCGKTKKKGRPVKVSKCVQCDQKFASRKELLRHHRIEHNSQTYTCSKCLKTFTRRHSYMRHIRSHREAPQLKCMFGMCVKVFRYKCNLDRHTKTHYKPSVKTFESGVEVCNMIDFEVDLEEKRIVGGYCGQLSVKQLVNQESQYKKNFTTFQSSLDLKSIEDWDIYVDLSNMLRIPLSNHKPSGSVESCLSTNTAGETTVKFAWNSFQSPEDIASEIVQTAVKDAVHVAILRDPSVADDEVWEIIDETVREIKEVKSELIDQLLVPVQEVGQGGLEGAGGLAHLGGIGGGGGVYDPDEMSDTGGTDGTICSTEVVQGCDMFDQESALVCGLVEAALDEPKEMSEYELTDTGKDLTGIDLEEVADVAGKRLMVVAGGSQGQSDGGLVSVKPATEKAALGLTCPHCGVLGISSTSKLMLHVDRMHSKPYTCIICKVEFVDRFCFNLHSPNCYHYCPIDGCNFKEKREARLKGHLRRHKMT